MSRSGRQLLVDHKMVLRFRHFCGFHAAMLQVVCKLRVKSEPSEEGDARRPRQNIRLEQETERSKPQLAPLPSLPRFAGSEFSPAEVGTAEKTWLDNTTSSDNPSADSTISLPVLMRTNSRPRASCHRATTSHCTLAADKGSGRQKHAPRIGTLSIRA